jgi:hypothetical protein
MSFRPIPPFLLPKITGFRIIEMRPSDYRAMNEALRIYLNMDPGRREEVLAGVPFAVSMATLGISDFTDMLNAFTIKWTYYFGRHFPYDDF